MAKLDQNLWVSPHGPSRIVGALPPSSPVGLKIESYSPVYLLAAAEDVRLKAL